jgi:peptidoglycan LD-endopeptidase CwlK
MDERNNMTPSQQNRYNSLHTKLQTIYLELQRRIIKLGVDWEPLIVSGHRDRAAQDDCVRRKTSKVIWPNSPHNASPSLAMDIQGMRNGALVQGKEAEDICKQIAEIVLKIATDKGISITWGGNFKNFKDLPHWELTNEWAALKRNDKKKLKGAS